MSREWPGVGGARPHGGRVYFSTGRASVKAQKLRANPRVRMAFGRRDGPALEGTARFCTEEPLVRRVVPLLNRKYGGYYGPNDAVAQGLLEGPSALVEVVPS